MKIFISDALIFIALLSFCLCATGCDNPFDQRNEMEKFYDDLDEALDDAIDEEVNRMFK